MIVSGFRSIRMFLIVVRRCLVESVEFVVRPVSSIEGFGSRDEVFEFARWNTTSGDELGSNAWSESCIECIAKVAI